MLLLPLGIGWSNKPAHPVETEHDKTENLAKVARHRQSLEKFAGDRTSCPGVSRVDKIDDIEIVGDEANGDVTETDVHHNYQGQRRQLEVLDENHDRQDVEDDESHGEYRRANRVKQMRDIVIHRHVYFWKKKRKYVHF